MAAGHHEPRNSSPSRLKTRRRLSASSNTSSNSHHESHKAAPAQSRRSLETRSIFAAMNMPRSESPSRSSMASRSFPADPPLRPIQHTIMPSARDDHIVASRSHDYRERVGERVNGVPDRQYTNPVSDDLVSGTRMDIFRKTKVCFRWIAEASQNDEPGYFDFSRQAFPLEPLARVGISKQVIVFACKSVSERHNFGDMVAVKTVKAEDIQSLEQAKGEVKTMSNLDHQHIIALLGSFSWNQDFGIVMFPVARYHLKTFLYLTGEREPAFQPQDLDLIRGFFPCLTGALVYLHKKRVKHRDIKPQNILIDQYGNIFIADFGISKRVPENEEFETIEGHPKHTETYAAPESMHPELNRKRGLPVDVFSLGCIFLEMVTVLLRKTVDHLHTAIGSAILDSTYGALVRRVVYCDALDKIMEWAQLLRSDLAQMERINDAQLGMIQRMLSDHARHRPPLHEVLHTFAVDSKVGCCHCSETPPSRSNAQQQAHTRQPVSQSIGIQEVSDRTVPHANGAPQSGPDELNVYREPQAVSIAKANLESISTAKGSVPGNETRPSTVGAGSGVHPDHGHAGNPNDSCLTHLDDTGRNAIQDPTTQERPSPPRTHKRKVSDDHSAARALPTSFLRDSDDNESLQEDYGNFEKDQPIGAESPQRRPSVHFRIYYPRKRSITKTRSTEEIPGKYILVYNANEDALELIEKEKFDFYTAGVFLKLPHGNGQRFYALVRRINLWKRLSLRINVDRMIRRIRFIFIRGDFPDDELTEPI